MKPMRSDSYMKSMSATMDAPKDFEGIGGLRKLPDELINLLGREQFEDDLPYGAAQDGRIRYATGRNEYLKRLEHLIFLGYDYDSAKEIAQDDDKYQIESTRGLGNAQGGRIGAQEGGLMDLGGMEKDYREEGGFVPIGGQERADDVPARLSKNEFVFTADAVRSAGGGDIDKGAEVMENVMNNLEQGGQISEDSQGLEGARNMFATAQRLEGVM